MSSTLYHSDSETDEEQPGQMSFLGHLDELRKRLMFSILFVFVAFLVSWFVSDYIYNFLARPVRQALADAQQRKLPLGGVTGGETVISLAQAKEGDAGRYVFKESTKLGASLIPAGASVAARVGKDAQGQTGLFTDEAIFAGNVVIPKGVRLPVEFNNLANAEDTLPGMDAKLVVNTVMEPFSLYMQVALYAAICLSVPFLLWQIWAFISPGLYKHERSYAMPFVLLSSISFVIGAAFAYYILFPPAARYLLGLGEDFQLLLKATDYFDFIILIMLAMGVVFQMPAVTYILARIGLVNAGFLIRSWKIALITILVAAAVLSPTSDILNMMLFAAPMLALYVVSIFVAWMCAKPRQTEAI